MKPGFRFLIRLALLLLLLPACGRGAVRQYGVAVVRTYPHDTHAYTQGLFFHGGKLFESTGLYGSSSFREVDLESGRVLRRLDFGRRLFVEGSVVLGGELFILTWQNHAVYVYDAVSLKFSRALSWPREGWGLTTDGRQLIASDGSSRLWFLDRDLRVQRSVEVKLSGRPVRLLNELEWVDGKVWANVYTTDRIVIIDPGSGQVEGVVDAKGLLPDALRGPDTDVLNGIARDAEGRIYLTGKNWPKLYQVRLVPKNNQP